MAATSTLDGLVSAPTREGQPLLFEPANVGAVGAGGSAVSGRKAGRPAGSKNRAPQEMREFYLQRYSDPLEGAIAWSLPADLLEGVRRALALARLLGCKPLEAFEFMRKSGEGAITYLWPRAVELRVDSRRVEVRIGMGAPPAAGSLAAGHELDQLRQAFEAARASASDDERALIDLAAREVENDDETTT